MRPPDPTSSSRPPDEPGLRFVMSGVLMGPDGDGPMAGAKMYFYHADGQGHYWRKGEEPYVNRIGGVLQTDDKGEYVIRSVLPGRYGGPPHIHVEVWGQHGLERLTHVELYPSPGTPVPIWIGIPAYREARNEFMAILSLDSNGVCHCTHDFRMRAMYPSTDRYDSLLRALSKRLEGRR